MSASAEELSCSVTVSSDPAVWCRAGRILSLQTSRVLQFTTRFGDREHNNDYNGTMSIGDEVIVIYLSITVLEPMSFRS